jgi:hypothetical protein
MMKRLLPLLLALAATPALAQTAPDPARLAAAKALVEAALPPSQRDTMIRGMITPIMNNMRASMEQSPEMAKMFENPKAREIFSRYLDKQNETSLEALRQSFPAMADAMASAYARHFTVAQLNEVRAFYLTPTGKAFIAEVPAVMADPELAAVQRKMMSDMLARLPDSLKQLTAELEALDQSPNK